MKLSLKIAAVIGVAATLLVILVSWLSLRLDLTLVEEDIRRDARLVAQSVALLVADLPPEEARARVARLASELPQVDVSWTDSAKPGAQPDHIEVVAAIGDGHYVHVSESLEPRERLRRASLKRMVLLSAIVLTISLIGGLALGRMTVGRRVNALVQKARRVAREDFDEPVEVGGMDELTLLASELNRMAGQLKRAREQSEIDVEARLQAEIQLSHADRLRTVGQLSAGIAHELGTPLNVVAGRAGLLKRHIDGTAEVVHVDVILDQTRRITSLVQGLMDYARRRPPAVVPTDLTVLIQEVADLLTPTLRSAGTAIETRGNINALMDVDPVQLSQVLTNLIMNAGQAAPGGSIRVTLIDSVDACAIVVEDDGPGIPQDIRDQVMEPFFTTQDPGHGTGLGLSVVDSIVRYHNGTVDIGRSDLGGARFRVELPRRAS